MNNEIGFYCPVVSNNTKDNLIISALNKISEKYSTILFNSKYDLIDHQRKFAVLHCNQSKYFYGDLFCFDIDSVSIIKTFPGPRNKFFVSSEIFWKNKSYPSKVWLDLIMNDINIITYDQYMYDMYDICFKTPSYLMSNGFSPEEFNDVVDSVCKS